MGETLEKLIPPLSQYVADTTIRLRSLHDRLRDPPNQLSLVIYEAEELRLLVGDLGNSFRQQRFFPPTVKIAVLEGLRLCQAGSSALRSVLIALEKDLQTQEKGKPLRYGTGTTQFGVVQEQLRQAKSALLLSKIAYDGEIQRQMMSKVLTALPQIYKSTIRDTPSKDDDNISVETEEVIEETDEEEEHRKSLTNVEASPPKKEPSQSSHWGSKFLGASVDVVKTSKESEASVKFSLELPAWFYRQRHQFMVNKSTQGWTTKLHTFRIVGFDAPVFRHSMNGDVAALERLFQANEASPLDIDPEGRTALHYTAMYARPAATRFLLKEGADPDVRTSWHGTFPRQAKTLDREWYPDYQQHVHRHAKKQEVWRGQAAYSTPLHLLSAIGGYLTYAGRSELSWNHTESDAEITDDIENTIKALTEKGDCDTLLEDQFGFTAFHLFTGRTGTFEWIRRHEELMLNNLSPEEVWNILWSRMRNFASWTGNSKGYIIREGIPGRKISKHLARNFASDSPLVSCGSFLSMITYEWAHSREILHDRLDGEWELLISELLAVGADLHVVATDQGIAHTIMMRLICACLLPSKIDATQALRKWLRVLVKSGVDLVDYGQQELALRDNQEGSWMISVDMGSVWASIKGHCKIQVIEVQMGKDPEDWHVEWDMDDLSVRWEDDGEPVHVAGGAGGTGYVSDCEDELASEELDIPGSWCE